MSKIYLLNEQKFDGVENLEVFEIEYLKFDLDLKKYDALVFTSKNAIFSLEENGINWKSVPSYVIAPRISIYYSNFYNFFTYSLSIIPNKKSMVYNL